MWYTIDAVGAELVRMHAGCLEHPHELVVLQHAQAPAAPMKKTHRGSPVRFCDFYRFFPNKKSAPMTSWVSRHGKLHTEYILFLLLKICILKKPIHFPVNPLAKSRRIWYNHPRAPVIRLYRQCSDTSMQVCHIRCMAGRLFLCIYYTTKAVFCQRVWEFLFRRNERIF